MYMASTDKIIKREMIFNIKISDLDDIIPIFFEMANPDREKNIYLFFDEIQNIENDNVIILL